MEREQLAMHRVSPENGEDDGNLGQKEQFAISLIWRAQNEMAVFTQINALPFRICLVHPIPMHLA